jgi:fucose permease
MLNLLFSSSEFLLACLVAASNRSAYMVNPSGPTRGAGLAMIGAATCSAVMGIISDGTNIQRASIVPLLCHAHVQYFALTGYKPMSSNIRMAGIGAI